MKAGESALNLLIYICLYKLTQCFPGGSPVKNLPAVQETLVRSLGWEDPLEKGMATHSGILAWEIPWTEEPGRLQSVGLQTIRRDLATKQEHKHTHTHMYTHTHFNSRLLSGFSFSVFRLSPNMPSASSIFLKHYVILPCQLWKYMLPS